MIGAKEYGVKDEEFSWFRNWTGLKGFLGRSIHLIWVEHSPAEKIVFARYLG